MKTNPEKPKALGVIPARGGSKRLPRKNILPIAGKPLLAHTIEAAQKSKRLTYYLVTTEDPEVLAVAREYGAPTPFVRPMELAGDNVRNIDTVHHAMTFLQEERGMAFDILVLLQPTCPVRDPEHIDQAIEKLWASDLDTAVSVKGPYKKRDPILKAVRDGVLTDYVPVPDPHDVEPFYLYNASIYAVKAEYFLRTGKLISPRQVPIFMDRYHSIDVDVEADFITAEAYLKHLGRGPEEADH